jgi:uncharacterized membrane protein YeaQ/YmgE (transglycosylase-associated protein family)
MPMKLSYLNVVLTYLTIGFASAMLIYFIFKRHVIGKFWGALIVGFIGSFLGGVIYQTFQDFFNSLAVFNDVNIFAAATSSLLLIWIFSKLSSSK